MFFKFKIALFAALCLAGNVWAECSCEHYFGQITGVTLPVSVAEACANLATEGQHNGRTDGNGIPRYYHFTELTGNISSSYGGSNYRIFINGEPFAPGSGISKDFQYVKDNFPQAVPEGGWYMYIHTSSQSQNFNVSGGTDYCAVSEGSIPSANNLVIGSVYFSSGNQSAATHSFVEIYNPTNGDISLTENGGYSLHYKNSSSEWYKLNLKGSIPMKHSFLVNMGKTGSKPVSFNQSNYKAGRLDLTGKFDKSFWDIVDNKIQHRDEIKVVLTVGNDPLTEERIDDEDYLDLVTITADLAKGRVRKRAADGKPDALLSIDFATLDLTKTICLPRNSDDNPWSETLTNAKDCPAFAESSAFETIGLQPGSDATGVNFNWYSSNAAGNANTFVRILSPNGVPIPIVQNTKHGSAPTTTASKFYHRTGVAGLQQGTNYKYQISNDGFNWGPVYDYETVPEGSFKFAAISDVQLGSSTVDSATWRTVATKLKNAGVNFIVHTGDQVDGTSTLNTEYTRFFAPPELRSIPFAPIMGNHDSHCEFIYRYNLPNEDVWPATCSGNTGYEMNAGANDGRFHAGNYYYLYNNILFVGLNTAYYPKDKEGAQSFVAKYDEVIKAAKAKYDGEYQFIIVNHHKSTQTISSHAADSDVEAYVQAGFEKVMTENGVSLVFSGHDHINVRSKFLVWDETLQRSVPNEPTPHPDNDEYPCAVDNTALCGPFQGDSTGTVYLTLSTASGMKTYGAYYAGTSQGGNISNSATFPYLVNGTAGKSNLNDNNPLLGMEKYQDIKTPEYTIVDVNDGVMTLKTYRNDNDNLIDKFTITTANKPKPAPPYTVPPGLMATYGDSILSVKFPEAGWSWEGTGTVGNAGTQTHKATFTPTDPNFRVVKGINVMVTVEKATPAYTAPTDLTAAYGDLLSSVTLPTGWTWESTGTVGNAGPQTHKAKFTPTDVDNYNIVTDVDVMVTVAKANPTYTVPTGLTATYGDELSSVKFPEAGWSWEETGTVGNAGTQTHKATFTPEDDDNYNVMADVDVTVTVDKATPAYTTPTGLTATYGDLLSSVSLPTDWSWESAGTVGNAGPQTHKAKFTPTDVDNYNIMTGVNVAVMVDKADPVYTVPTNLTAAYGDELSSVKFPEAGWSWESTGTVGNLGKQTHKAEFTPNDVANYNVVTGVDLTVMVDKAIPAYTVPTGLKATYGDLLSSVSLPTDWSWESAGTVGDAGPQIHKATFTPNDFANYNIVTGVNITVTVAKVDPKDYTVPTGLTATYGTALSSVTLPTYWTWESAGTTLVGNIGIQTHEVKFTPTDVVNYNIIAGVNVTITVTKATPAYTTPTGLTATYGDLLSSVSLPTNWSWESTGTVGDAGPQTHKAKFTPSDRTNYKVVRGIDVTVAVAKADLKDYTVPTGLTVTYGDLLSSVTLPTGWSWESTGTVGNAGTQTHKATFTPSDFANYNIVTGVNVTVTVSKAPGAGTVTITGWTYGDVENARHPDANGTGDASHAYKVSGANDDTYSEDIPVNAGSYTVRTTFAESHNHHHYVHTAHFVIAKATPAYAAPTGLTAVYSDALSSVTLPEGWAWESTGTVGNVGTQTHKAKFTHTDVANYNVVAGIDLTVTVTNAPPSSSSQKQSSSSQKPSSSSQKSPSSSSQPPSSSSQEPPPLSSSSQELPSSSSQELPPSSSSQEELPSSSSQEEQPSYVLPKIATGNLLTQMRNGINLTAKTSTTIAIYNLSGKLISRQEYLAGNHSISLGHLPKGVYIVKASHGSEKQILQIPVR